MPHPLLGCQIKGEIKGFLLMYRLFCISNGSIKILKKAGGKFSKKIISARALTSTKKKY